MREGSTEVVGILPVGAAYPMIQDRSATRLDQPAGKRIGVFDQAKPQALLIQQVGALAVSVDISNVGSKFNNGMVDMIHLPAITYQPFELSKGMGTQGTVVREPAMFPTVQMLFNADQLPPGFNQAHIDPQKLAPYVTAARGNTHCRHNSSTSQESHHDFTSNQNRTTTNCTFKDPNRPFARTPEGQDEACGLAGSWVISQRDSARRCRHCAKRHFGQAGTQALSLLCRFAGNGPVSFG